MTLTYAYDGDSNETSVSDSLGGLVTLTYDARDELTNETFSGTGLSAEAVTYAYDNAGRLTGLTRYSNLAETTMVAATAYSYDHANRMTGIVDSNSTGTTLVSYGYTYDAADRVSQETRTWASGESSDTLTYSYTNNNQLTGVSHTNGSFTNESFTGRQRQRNRHRLHNEHRQRADRFAWLQLYLRQRRRDDVEDADLDRRRVDVRLRFPGRMVTAVEKTSGGTTLESVTYTYDALDNRIGMDENGTQTWTLYDGGNADHGLQRVRLFDNAVFVGTDGDRRQADLGRHGVVVPGRSARHGPRPDQQLRRHHRPRGFQRVRDGARRDEPDERRPDDGLCEAGAGYGHGAESWRCTGRKIRGRGGGIVRIRWVLPAGTTNFIGMYCEPASTLDDPHGDIWARISRPTKGDGGKYTVTVTYGPQWLVPFPGYLEPVPTDIEISVPDRKQGDPVEILPPTRITKKSFNHGWCVEFTIVISMTIGPKDYIVIPQFGTDPPKPGQKPGMPVGVPKRTRRS